MRAELNISILPRTALTIQYYDATIGVEWALTYSGPSKIDVMHSTLDRDYLRGVR